MSLRCFIARSADPRGRVCGGMPPGPRTHRAASVQKKSATDAGRDRFELEAARVAEQIVSGSGTARFANIPPSNESSALTQLTSPAPHAALPATVRRALRSAGEPLPAQVRAFMESRFGYDFGQVRVHADNVAAESAREINAAAYTVGQDIAFDHGRFQPHMSSGRRLLAHELTHVIQQTSNSGSGSPNSKSPQVPARQQADPESPSESGQAAVDVALGEVGVKEDPSGSNRGPCEPGAARGCVDAYTGGRADPWCAHFLSWSFEQAGSSPFGHIASVYTLRNWGRSQGSYVEVAAVQQGSFVPANGDIFTKPRYEGSGQQRRLVGGHTGLVVRYDDGIQLLETVEGNLGNSVQLTTRNLTELDGFIRIRE